MPLLLEAETELSKSGLAEGPTDQKTVKMTVSAESVPALGPKEAPKKVGDKEEERVMGPEKKVVGLNGRLSDGQ